MSFTKKANISWKQKKCILAVITDNTLFLKLFLKVSALILSKSRQKIDKLLKGPFWISSYSSFIQYCDSNIGLFSIAPPLVIALPTLWQQSCRS